jgi:lipid A 3-O-deacylase
VSHADGSLGGGFLSATFENDALTGKDGGYTNGVGITWGRWGLHDFSTENVPGWMHGLGRNLYISTQPGKDRAVSYTFAQAIHTPSDIKVPTLIEDEPPYAGLLSWSGHLHAFDDRVVDTLTLCAAYRY